MRGARAAWILLLAVGALAAGWRLRSSRGATADGASSAPPADRAVGTHRAEGNGPISSPGEPPTPRPGTTIVTGRMVDVGGFRLARVHLTALAVRVKEAAEPRNVRRTWTFPEDDGRFGIEVPAGARPATLVVAHTYMVNPEVLELSDFHVERDLPFRIEGAPVVDLGDVPLPAHPLLGSIEGEAQSAGAVGVEIRTLYLEGRTRGGHPVHLAGSMGLSHAPNAPQGHCGGSRFAVGPLPPGDYELWVGADGHETLRTSLGVAAGQAIRGLRVVLQPSRLELKGVVLDAGTGRAIAGAELWLREKTPDPGRRERLYVSEGLSAADGSYALKIAGLPACGIFEIRAAKPPWAGTTAEIPVAEFAGSGSVVRTLRLVAGSDGR